MRVPRADVFVKKPAKTKQFWLPVFGVLLLLFLSIWLCGCAQWDTKTVRMSVVGGDVWIRSIGSDNQYRQDGTQTSTSVSTPGLAGTQIPPMAASYVTTGMFAGHSVRIEHVSGSVFIEEAVNRNQGISVPDALGKLFQPGDPFAVIERSTP